jgi:TonB-linked SusC/RagA family outer membrane protein
MCTIIFHPQRAYFLLLFIFTAFSLSLFAQVKPKKGKVNPKRDTLIVQPVTDVNFGYFQINRSKVIGAVSFVRDNQLNQTTQISADAMLLGQAAGLKAVSTSGTPGSGAILTVRGISTFNGGTSPLFIVDGIPIKGDRFTNPVARNADNNPLSDIHPSDIASITVLKDGYSTAMYGMRGSNGVILINTYAGTNGKTLLDFSGYSGIAGNIEKLDVLNADQYRSYILAKEQARGLTSSQINSGIGKYLLLSTPASQVERYNNNTDWQDVVRMQGLYNDYHLNLRGGDEVSKYSVNVGYTTVGGAIAETNFNRFTTRFNLDYKIGRKLSFLNTLSYTKTTRTLSDEGNALNTNALFLSAVKSPILTSFKQDIQGNNLREVDSADYAGRNNPYALVNNMRNENNTNRITGKITGQYAFSPHLNLRVGVGGDFYRLDEKRFRPSAGFLTEGYVIRSSSEKNSSELMVINENVLNYDHASVTGKHAFNLYAGNAFQINSQDSKYGIAVNATSDEFGNINTSDQKSLDSIGSFSPEWRLMSFFAGGQYTFNNRYILGANIRTDGSSRFEEGHQWGYFPSASFSWALNKEDFLKDSRYIEDLKLRASYGLTGNQDVGFYNAFNVLTPAIYQDYAGVKIGSIGNPEFTWEKTRQFNIGIDLGLKKDRFNASLDFYSKKTSDLYNIVSLPSISGFSSYAVSEGGVNNKGIELAIASKISDGKFKWTLNISAAYNKNTTTSYPDLSVAINNFSGFSTLYSVGGGIGSFYGLKALGIYSSTSDVKLKNGANNLYPFQGGDIIFEDKDGNGIIDQNDRQVIGNTNPDYFGGISNIFSYRNFDLNIFVDFSIGNEIYNGTRAALEAMSNYDNQSTAIDGRWRNEGDITDIPRLLHGDAVGNTRFSSRWIEDGSFARIRSLTLGYNFPLQGKLKKIFKNARVQVSGQNLYTLTNYKGFSPDLASVTNPVNYGIDYGAVPQLKTFILGLKLGL